MRTQQDLIAPDTETQPCAGRDQRLKNSKAASRFIKKTADVVLLFRNNRTQRQYLAAKIPLTHKILLHITP